MIWSRLSFCGTGTANVRRIRFSETPGRSLRRCGRLFRRPRRIGDIDRRMEAAQVIRVRKSWDSATSQKPRFQRFSHCAFETQILAEKYTIRGIRECHRRMRDVSKVPAGGVPKTGWFSKTAVLDTTCHPFAGRGLACQETGEDDCTQQGGVGIKS